MMRPTTLRPPDPALPGLEAIRRKGPGVLRVPGADLRGAAGPIATRIAAAGLVAAICAALFAGAGRPSLAATVAQPVARVETAPVPHKGDAADDPAIWIHPSDPGKSLLLGTDKQGGLHRYALDGSDLGVVSDGSQPNNVDVLYGFALGGARVDLAIASVRGKRGRGVKIWSIDSSDRSLTDVTANLVLETLRGKEPYGICGYRSPRTGRFSFFVTSKSGAVEQWEMEGTAAGKVAAKRARAFSVDGASEGCVADNDLGVVYIAVERHGIVKLDAEPGGGTIGRYVARVGRDGLTADVEGLAIYYGTGARGYLIASSQGSDTFIVYDRGTNIYLMAIDPAEGRIDDVSDTDGIDVTSCRTTAQFPSGVLVVQDGSKAGGHQNFKLYSWEDIAGGRLLTDVAWSPRTVQRGAESVAGTPGR